MQGLSPMMQQYFRIKEQHKEHVLFFRLGDFYEMFFDDAVEISQELGLTLTGRDCGLAERAPMCGVPYHSAEAYIARLVKNGHKVAICEQVEDPAFAKGVVSREVVRVVTPGTLVEDNLLQEDTNNFLCSIFYGGGGYGLVFADISTGEMHAMELTGDDAVINELARYMPREVIFNSEFLQKAELAKYMREKLFCTADLIDDTEYEPKRAVEKVLGHFGKQDIAELNLAGRERCVPALGGLFSYLHDTQKQGIERLITLNIQEESRYMNLNASARANLELLQAMHTKERRGSLLWVLDKTKTPMGKRLIKSWISQPLLNHTEIEKRLNAVQELYQNELLCAEIAEKLAAIFDMERMITRVVYGSATPREYKAMERALASLPALKAALHTVKAIYLTDILREIDPLEDVREGIARAIREEPPNTVKDGGVICDGYNPQLDEWRALMGGARAVLSTLENEEREKTGIKNLKIGFNQVFGYYIEVTKSNLDMVPERYIRKQTLAGCERYIIQELKDLEHQILSAAERAKALERELFEGLRAALAKELPRIQRTASAIARLDVFASFAAVSLQNRYVRPDIALADSILIKDGRHPVVEKMLGGFLFVPNDTLLDCTENQIAVITGPNMAGKSTFMRQTALIVLMAQIGCFVPAVSASIGVVDGIYTRIGASDDLASGQSTFMMEMVEVSDILRSATPKSLLILDEIGRGTSTYDGMSIARAVIEYVADPKRLGAKTMFATHYHELTEMENDFNRIKNYNTAVKKRGDDITFLRKIVRGGADDSYGIEVSKLAGIPDGIVRRAREILKDLEQNEPVRLRGKAKRRQEAGLEDIQIAFQAPSPVEDELRAVDLNALTPIEALTLLYKLKGMLSNH